MGKNDNQKAKQACENVPDLKHYSTTGILGTRSWKLGEDKKFGGSNNNSSNKIRVIIIVKINEHLLCATV